MNKNTKCPIDAHCHRHCRRDPRITKDCIEVLSFRVFFDFGKKFELHWFELKLLGLSAPQEPIFSSGSVVAFMPKITRSQT